MQTYLSSNNVDDDTRLQIAEEGLRKTGLLGERQSLTPAQRKAILEAHEIAMGKNVAKGHRLMSGKLFTREAAEYLMDAGICGKAGEAAPETGFILGGTPLRVGDAVLNEGKPYTVTHDPKFGIVLRDPKGSSIGLRQATLDNLKRIPRRIQMLDWQGHPIGSPIDVTGVVMDEGGQVAAYQTARGMVPLSAKFHADPAAPQRAPNVPPASAPPTAQRTPSHPHQTPAPSVETYSHLNLRPSQPAQRVYHASFLDDGGRILCKQTRYSPQELAMIALECRGMTGQQLEPNLPKVYRPPTHLSI